MVGSDFGLVSSESALWLVVSVEIGFDSGFDSGDGFDFFTCTSSFSLLDYIFIFDL